MILGNQALKGTEEGLVFINIWELCIEDFPVEGKKKWSESEGAFQLIPFSFFFFFRLLLLLKIRTLFLMRGEKNTKSPFLM